MKFMQEAESATERVYLSSGGRSRAELFRYGEKEKSDIGTLHEPRCQPRFRTPVILAGVNLPLFCTLVFGRWAF
jgi:hypothetical protein